MHFSPQLCWELVRLFFWQVEEALEGVKNATNEQDLANRFKEFGKEMVKLNYVAARRQQVTAKRGRSFSQTNGWRTTSWKYSIFRNIYNIIIIHLHGGNCSRIFLANAIIRKRCNPAVPEQITELNSIQLHSCRSAETALTLCVWNNDNSSCETWTCIFFFLFHKRCSICCCLRSVF